MMSYLIEKLQKLGIFNYPEEQDIINGYALMSDSKLNKTLVMVKTSENSWKTKWVQNNLINIKEPSKSIQSIFNPNKK